MKKSKCKYFTTSTRAFDFNPIGFLIEFAQMIQGYDIIGGEARQEKNRLENFYILRLKIKKRK